MQSNKVKFLDNFEQRSPEWFKAKVGKVSGSKAVGLTTPARQKTYLLEKLTEIITGEIEKLYVTEPMQHGIDTEPIAKKAYEDATGNSVTEVGLVTNSDYKWAVLSPDGLVDGDGAIEIKCTGTKKHISNILDGSIPTDYYPQITFYFLILEDLQWLDFISYDDRCKQKPLHIVRITRDEIAKDVQKMKENYLTFEKMMMDSLEKIL